MTERLFVYGTLAPGQPNEHVLSQIGGTWETAIVTGSLREEGWGAAMGFPGIDLGANGEAVQGFVFSSDNLTEFWPKLDAFEGDAYERVLACVKLDSGETVDAYIYTLK